MRAFVFVEKEEGEVRCMYGQMYVCLARSEVTQKLLELLKEALDSPPVLVHPDYLV